MSSSNNNSHSISEKTITPLEHTQNLSRYIINTLRNDHEDIRPALRELSIILEKYINKDYSNEEYGYIKNNLLQSATVFLMKREHLPSTCDYDLADEIQRIARLLVRIATPMITEDSELGADMLHHLMNPNYSFYKEYGHDWRQQRGTPLNEEEIKALDEFRTKITENVQLDYLHNNRWKSGTVRQARQEQMPTGQIITLLEIRCDFGPQRTRSSNNEAFIDTCIFEPAFYGHYAPHGTQVVKFHPIMPKWRKELIIDSQCDCLDSVNKWYTCHVIAIDEIRNRVQLNYDEWSNKYDEWINKDNIRLQKLFSHAKGGRTSGGVFSPTYEINVKLEDEDDPTDENIYAIHRGELGQASFHLVAVLNEFGRANGFDALLQRLDNHKPNMPVNNMRYILGVLSKSIKTLTRRTYYKYLAPLHERVWTTLESMTDVELRDLKKEFLSRIVQAIEEILRRDKSEEEVAQITETFQLTMALRRLTSQTIERRVNGVQHIAWVCSSTRKSYSSHSLKFITVEFLTKWIEENKLLELLFGPKSHPQLMKQATDILKFICLESVLTIDHLEIIWSALERAASKLDDVDNELQTLCKVIDDIAYHMNADHFEFLFKKFESIPLNQLSEHHLQLMKDLARQTYKQTTASGPAERSVNILWTVVQDESPVDDKLANEAKNLMKEVLSAFYSRDLRLPTLIKCVTNLSEHKSVVSSLQILEKVVQLYPNSSNIDDEADRWTIVAHLDNEFSMMKNFFADIQFFKEKAHAKAKELFSSSEQKDGGFGIEQFSAINHMKCARFTYLDEIRVRLDFLDYILSQSTIRLKKEHIDIIWDALVVGCLTPEEREEAFKWFRKMMTGARFKSLDDDIPEHLFINKFLTDIAPYSMTMSAYESFEKFFLFVNRNKGNLQTADGGKSFYVTNYDELVGVDYLWHIVLDAREEVVNQKSIAFLNLVCNRLGSDLKSQVGRIRKLVLERAMKELAQTIETYKKSPKLETRNQCIRILDLINQFLNATESRGLGEYRSHNALSRGKKWHLNIVDRIAFTGYGKPPHFRLAIHENDTLWELRCSIGTKVNQFPEMLQLYAGNKLEEDRNSSTIASLNIRDGSSIHVSLKDDKAQRVPLVTSGSSPQLVELAKVALENIYKKFAKNPDGTMTHNDMRDYILACGAGESSAGKSRIQSIFTQHGDLEDRLDVTGFLNFYRQAAIDRPEHVWNDLSVFKYRYDLRLEDDVRKEEEEMLANNPETLPRYILAHEAKYFNLLFNDCLTLGDPLVLSAAWKLLLRLPTNDTLRVEVLTLKIIEKEEDWEKLLPTNNLFRLVYSLLICESLTVSPESFEDDNALQHRVEWRSQFLKKKGFEHLLRVLRSIKYEEKGQTTSYNNTLDIDAVTKNTQQLAIASVLKMIYSIFLSAVDCIPGMESIVEQIRDISATNTSAEEDNSKENKEKDTKTAKDNKRNSGQAPMAPARTSAHNVDGIRKGSFESGEWNDIDLMASYYMDGVSSDDDSGDEDDQDNLVSQLEKKFEEDVNKASSIPMDMLSLLSANMNDPQEGMPGSAGGEPGTYGPHLPPEGDTGNGYRMEEKADRDEKVPDVVLEKVTEEQKKINSSPQDVNAKKEENNGNEQQKLSATVKQTSVRFNELIKSTMAKFSDDLIKSLNFDELLLQLLYVLKSASMDPHPTQERDWVVRYAVRLWVSVLLLRPSLLPDLFKTLKNDPSFILGALHSTDREIGSEFAKSLRKLCRTVNESPMYTPELKKTLPEVEVTRFFLRDILLKYLPKGSQEDIDPEQHFYLLISLMQEYTEKYQSSVSEFGDLFKYLVEQLKLYKSRETYEDSANDKVLTGLMSLFSVLLAGDKSFRKQAGECGLIEEIFNHFLFATGKTEEDQEHNWPKCKTNTNRKLGFRLLTQLCMETPENFERLYKLIKELHEVVKAPSEYDHSPDRHVRSTRGYVGLKNLGSTCYMNSLLQQFYMMPHFRNAVIWSGSEKAEQLTAEEQTDSILYQVMRMFSYLTLSEKQAFNTKEFCRSYKDETGNPVNVRIQQDVQEFFNILTDRIENELKNTKFRYLLQDCFGGKVVNQMICQGGCGSVREREQDFMMISLPIKSRANMKESLDAYVQPEQLEGVQCDTCNNKCNTLKREVLYKLPNSIFVHLKRFELNFETFRHEKSNQRFEFPEEMNLEPYTKEGLERLEKEKAKATSNNPNIEVPQPYSLYPPEYYKYKLVGVTVHTGSADAGHYYSYIKDRKTGQWNEFNDNMIKPFDLKDLDKECFGGKKASSNNNSWGMDWDNQERIKNGYILVYEREKFLPPEHNKGKEAEAENKKAQENSNENKKTDNEDQKEIPSEDAKSQEKKSDPDEHELDTEFDKDNLVQPQKTDASMTPSIDKKEEQDNKEEKKAEPIDVLELLEIDPSRIMAAQVKKDIINNNMEFMRDRQVFNPSYFKFLFDILRMAPVPPFTAYNDTDKKNIGFPVIELATKVCFQYIAKTADRQSIFNKFVVFLKWLFENNIPACKWLLFSLSDKPGLVCEYLLKTREVGVMRGFSELLVHVLKTLKPFEEQDLYKTETITRTKKTKGGPKEVEEVVGVTCSARIMGILIPLIDVAPKHWVRFSYFFNVFRDFAQLGPHQSIFLVRRQLIEKLGDFYLGSQSPYAVPNKQYPQMGSRMYPPKFESTLQILSLLIRTCHTPATQALVNRARESNSDTGTPQVKFPKTSLLHKNSNGEDDLLELSPQDAKLPQTKEFYVRMIASAHTSKETMDVLNEIVCHWSFENQKYSTEVAAIISEGIDRSNAEHVGTYFNIMDRFISIEDSLQQERLEQLHGKDSGVLYLINLYRLQHQPFSFNAIRCVVDIMGKNEIYRNFMLQKRNDWKWWDTWLDNYINRRSYYGSSVSSDSLDKKFLESYLQMLAQNNIEANRSTFREEPRSHHQSYNGSMHEGIYDLYDNNRPEFYSAGNNLAAHAEEPEPGHVDDLADSDDDLHGVSSNGIGSMALPSAHEDINMAGIYGPAISDPHGPIAPAAIAASAPGEHPPGHDAIHEPAPSAAHEAEPARATHTTRESGTSDEFEDV